MSLPSPASGRADDRGGRTALIATLTGRQGVRRSRGCLARHTPVLPEEYVGRAFRNLVTGEVVEACRQGASPCLSVAELLTSFPTGLMELLP